MKIIAIIPARASSKRFYNKPLAMINGVPMLQHVVNNVRKLKRVSQVIVATDSIEILDFCKNIVVDCMITSLGCPTATDRVIEVSKVYSAELYLMVNGDEPLVTSADMEILINEYFLNPLDFYVSNLMGYFSNHAEVIDSSNLKIVTNDFGRCLFISRSPIPYPKGSTSFDYKKFIGVQLYSKSALEYYSNTPIGTIEKIEENDTFRFIENGIEVYFYPTRSKTLSVDSPVDIIAVEDIMSS